jgi:hypothetical protein
MTVSSIKSSQPISVPPGVQKPKLDELNKLFLNSYAIRKADVQKSLGVTTPVVILNGDSIVVKHQGQTTNIPYVPDSYHVLKDIAHIACLIDTLQNLQAKGSATSIEIESYKIKALHLLGTILESLKKEGSNASGLKKYEPLLLQYIGILKGTEPLKASDLVKSLNEIIKDAAVIRIDALHKHMQYIEKRISPDQWSRLAIIVMGPRMPREGELGWQYMKKMVLRSPDVAQAKMCPHLSGHTVKTSDIFQGKRLIYTESIFDVEEAMKQLAVEITDEGLGKAVLGHKSLMHGDLLRHPTSAYLQTLSSERASERPKSRL